MFRKCRKWYPPTRFVFYPLYRRLRRRWRLPCAAAYFAVWTVSGFLHGAVLLVFGNPIPAVVFTLIFIGLGMAGVGAITMKNRKRRLQVGELVGRSLDRSNAEPGHCTERGRAASVSNSGAVGRPRR